jgi:hypothetical protein
MIAHLSLSTVPNFKGIQMQKMQDNRLAQARTLRPCHTYCSDDKVSRWSEITIAIFDYCPVFHYRQFDESNKNKVPLQGQNRTQPPQVLKEN